MSELVEKRVAGVLATHKQKGTYRRLGLKSYEGVDFISNDYLGYARNKKIFDSFTQSLQKKVEGLDRYLGSTGSRLLSGNSDVAEETEATIAEYFCAKESLFFQSGYQLNVSLLQGLCEPEDIIVLDENAHTSIKNGAKLAKSSCFYFYHNSADHLEKRLKRIRINNKHRAAIWVYLEGVDSMAGDLTPLRDFVSLAQKYDCQLIVDEAHSTGIFGEKGKGLCVKENLQDNISCRVITFGKSWGVSGAALCCSPAIKKLLINRCHGFIYSTAPSLLQLLSVKEVLAYRKKDLLSVKNLFSNIDYFSKQLGLTPHHNTPIFALIWKGSLVSLRKQADHLCNKGFLVKPVFSPTVRRGFERLRICLHSTHTRRDLDTLAEELYSYVQDGRFILYNRH